MASRIFITTNWDSLVDRVLPKSAPNRNGNSKGINVLSNNNPILYFDMLNLIFQSNAIETEIILLHDESYNTVINNLGIKKEADYLLHHSIPNNPTPSYGELFGPHFTIGQHELAGPKYPEVFEVIFNDGITNKSEKIIEILFPTTEIILGKKLDLLHSLIVPPVDTTEANGKWADIKKTVQTARASGITVSLATNEDALTIFQKAVNGINDPFNPDYIKALADLRDAILPS